MQNRSPKIVFDLRRQVWKIILGKGYHTHCEAHWDENTWSFIFLCYSCRARKACRFLKRHGLEEARIFYNVPDVEIWR